MPKTCERCGTSYHRPYGMRRAKYCSVACGNETQTERAAALRLDKAAAEAKLWRNVQKRGPDECWNWQGSIANGYGRISRVGAARYEYAHRVAYMTRSGEWPRTDQYVLHSCDNRLCCNPAHLSGGTHRENIRQAVERGRYPLGEAVSSARLTSAQIQDIRKSPEPHTVLAQRFGVHPTTILRARRGETWAKAHGDTENRRRRVMAQDDIVRIASEQGTLREVAKRVGWHEVTVLKARRLFAARPVTP